MADTYKTRPQRISKDVFMLKLIQLNTIHITTMQKQQMNPLDIIVSFADKAVKQQIGFLDVANLTEAIKALGEVFTQLQTAKQELKDEREASSEDTRTLKSYVKMMELISKEVTVDRLYDIFDNKPEYTDLIYTDSVEHL